LFIRDLRVLSFGERRVYKPWTLGIDSFSEDFLFVRVLLKDFSEGGLKKLDWTLFFGVVDLVMFERI
jgi:hypothetical protein